jgi:hypothetical protein
MAMSFSRNPTGSVELGLFLIALSPFALSIFLPHFGVAVAGGVAAAVFLAGRRPQVPHIDPRSLDDPDRERP